MAHLGFDIDGVLADFHTAYLNYFNRRHDTAYHIDAIWSHEFWNILPITQEECLAQVEDLFTHHFVTILPMQKAQEVVTRLARTHYLSAITSRPKQFAEKTSQFLDTYFRFCFGDRIHYSAPFYTRDGGKAHFCKQVVGVDLYVEDCVPYANAVAKENIPVALIDQPWNRHEDLHPLVTRTTLADLETRIPLLLNGHS